MFQAILTLAQPEVWFAEANEWLDKAIRAAEPNIFDRLAAVYSK